MTDHAVESIFQILNLQPVFLFSVRLFMGNNGQKDNALVQNLVMFQIVQQGERNSSQSTGQKDGGSFYAVRRVSGHVLKQKRQWKCGTLQFFSQNPATGLPRGEQCEDDESNS